MWNRLFRTSATVMVHIAETSVFEIQRRTDAGRRLDIRLLVAISVSRIFQDHERARKIDGGQRQQGSSMSISCGYGAMQREQGSTCMSRCCSIICAPLLWLR